MIEIHQPELPAYTIPNYLVEFTPHHTVVPIGFWRSVENSYNGFVIQSFIDEVAAEMGMMPGLSICGLSDGATYPIRTIVRKFRNEFEDYIRQEDPQRVEEEIVQGRTRAIMLVHLFGQPANMTALREIARQHNLRIIEDAAQAHGATSESGPVGSLGDAAGFSFQSFKNLSCGEGGALTTNDEELFNRAYALHNAGRPRVGTQRGRR